MSHDPRKGDDKRRVKGEPPTAPPSDSPSDPDDVEGARSRALAELYRPIREAAEATLASKPAGAKVLKAAQGLGSELNEIVRRMSSDEGSLVESSHATHELRMRFRKRYGSAWLDALAANEWLQPSAEAVARIIDAGSVRDRRVWTAQIRPFEAILLTPTDAPDDVGTVQQGLGDPEPAPPVRSCLLPPYARKETNLNTQLFSFGYASADPNGRVYVSATGAAADGVGGGATAEGFVGSDINVPAGHQDYEVVVDVDFDYSASSWAVFGASGCGSEILIRIDKGDGSAMEEQKASLFWLVSPVLWGNGAAGSGNRRLVMPFRRSTSSAGQVRVMVGGAAHGGAWALAAIASVTTSLTIKEVCVNSTM